MRRWQYAEYRDFDEVPRTIVCSGAPGTFLFLCRAAADGYADHYEVYRLPPLRDGEACASWFGLETRATQRLDDLPVEAFPFDPLRREFLPYDPIEPLLRGGRGGAAAR